MRRRFLADATDTLIREFDKLPGDAFPLSAERVWEVVRSQKDLNLPAHKVMVATIRCAEIMEEQLRQLQSDQAWEKLQQACKENSPVLEGFGAQLGSLLDSCLVG